MDKCEWWNCLMVGEPSEIQWSPAKGGVVRAKIDTITNWEYKVCPCAKSAIGIGAGIIDKQRAEKWTEKPKKKIPPC